MSENEVNPLQAGDQAGLKDRTDYGAANTEENELRHTSLAKLFDTIGVNAVTNKRSNLRNKLRNEPQEGFGIDFVSDLSGNSNLSMNEGDHTKRSGVGGRVVKYPSDNGGSGSEPGSGDEGSGGDEPEDEEEVDWDEEIPDDDIRMVLAANAAVDYIMRARAKAIKPGYEQFSKFIEYFDSLKPVLILLIAVFTVMARPIWCANLGSNVNWECTRGMDPEDPVEYPSFGLPVLSASTKRVVLMMSMTIIMAMEILKIVICRGDLEQRVSFFMCLICMICYSIGFMLVEFEITKITFLDIFSLLFVVLGINSLKKIMIKFMKVMVDAKDVIFFFILFVIATAMISRILFFRFEDYYDAEGSQLGFNFKTFKYTLYSLTVENLMAENFVDLVMGMRDGHMFLMFYWFGIAFFNKFMLANFLCGALYGAYFEYFNRDIEYFARDKFKAVRCQIKEKIYHDKLVGTTFTRILDNYIKGDVHADKINDIEEYYQLTMTERQRIKKDAAIARGDINPDSMEDLFNRLDDNKLYQIVLGGIEGLNYILIIIAFEMQIEETFYLLLFIVLISSILVIDRIAFLINNYVDTNTKWIVMDILISFLITGLGMQCMAISDKTYFDEMMPNNRDMFKWLSVLFVAKSIRFLKLFAYNPEIKIVTGVIFDSLAFISDVLGIIVVFFFLFSALSISMFGGNVNSNTPAAFEARYGDEPDDLLMMMHFNDYPTSIFSLFTIMMAGYTGTLRLVTSVIPEENNTMLYNIFFLIYFFFVNMCFLNVLFGFFVDNVSAGLDSGLAKIEEEEEARKAKEGGADEGDGSVESDDKPEFDEMNKDLDNFIGLANEKKKAAGAFDSQAVSELWGNEDWKLNDQYDPVAKAVDKVQT